MTRSAAVSKKQADATARTALERYLTACKCLGAVKLQADALAREIKGAESDERGWLDNMPTLEGIERELQDLEASARLGQITAAELEQRRNAISGERATIESMRAEGQVKVDGARRVRAGLERRLRESEQEAESLEAELRELRTEILIEEAHLAAEEYARYAAGVMTMYLRLTALHFLIKRHADPGTKINLLGHAHHQFFLPKFGYPEMSEGDPGWRSNALFVGRNPCAAEYLGRSDAYDEARATEVERLKGMGVDL